MGDESLLGPPAVRRRLSEVSRRPLNFDLGDLEHPGPGWEVTDLSQELPAEPPGMPIEHGSWEIARRLMRGYAFADPSIVRAYYDPALPLPQRTMLLKLQALGLVHLFVGVRVGDVYEHIRPVRGRQVRIWGWNYRTLEGHVEMGQMDWEVWKWLETGEVEFRVHAISRPAPISNPIVRIGFHVLRGHERAVFLNSTRARMRTLVEAALEQGADPGSMREVAVEATARRSQPEDAAHDEVADLLRASTPEREP